MILRIILPVFLLVSAINAQTAIFVVPDQAATQEGRITFVSRDGYGAGAPKGVTHYAPSTMPGGSYQLIWPTTKPASGEVLAYSSEPSAGTIQLDWVTGGGGGGSAVGGTGAVQFSLDGTGAFSGDTAKLMFNTTDVRLGIGTATPLHKLHLVAGAGGSGIVDGLRIQYGSNIGDGGAIVLGNTATAIGSRIAAHTSSGSTVDLEITSGGGHTSVYTHAGGWVFPGTVTASGNFIAKGSAFQVAFSSGTVTHSWLVGGTSNVSDIVNSAAQSVIRLDSQAGVVYIGAGAAHSLNVSGNVVPSGNLIRDLGHTGSRWNHIYGGDITLTTGIANDITSGSIDPITHNTGHLGDTGKIWAIVNASLFQAGTNASITGGVRFYNASVSGNATLNGRSLTGAVDIEFDLPTGAAIYPDTNNGHDNGLATRRWSRLYIGTAVNAPNGNDGFSGSCASTTTLTVSGGIITGCS